jgi:tetrapyrrole methylase family protein/MazG family protein
VVVVGLGPAGADHLVPAGRTALERVPRRFVRTTRHPAVADLARDGITFEAFDRHYEAAPDLASTYAAIVADLLEAAARDREVAYAVPGNPSVAERTVELLHDAAARGEIDLVVVAGQSFTDLVWARLGVDPLSRAVRVVDARAIDRADLSGPMVVAQCDDPLVLSDVKLALLEQLDADTPVTVLQRLGLGDEQVTTVALEDLDRVVVPDHLTSLFVDAPVDGALAAAPELVRLLRLAKRLRDPGGCPWDAEQTHHSLTRYLLEESY